MILRGNFLGNDSSDPIESSDSNECAYPVSGLSQRHCDAVGSRAETTTSSIYWIIRQPTTLS